METGKFMVNMLKLTSGCTEPAAVALNGAYAGKYMERDIPEYFELVIDELTYKNAFNAGIPYGKDKRGAMWAAFLGYAAAAPDKSLEVFTVLNDDMHSVAETIHEKTRFDIRVVEKEGLYVSIEARTTKRNVRVTTEREHTNITELIVDGERVEIVGGLEKSGSACDNIERCYNTESWSGIVSEMYSDPEVKAVIQKGIEVNINAAEWGLRYDKSADDYGVAGAIYARMSGDPIAVMSVAGSGNKGLASIIPAYRYAVERGCSPEKAEKSALLSAFVTALVTHKFGSVSSVCGVVYSAGTGVLAGMMYADDELDAFEGAFRNYASSVGGIFCDGAKGSCALKGSSAVIMARRSRELMESGFEVDEMDGYLGDTFKCTLENLIKYNEHFARFDKSTIGILQDKA